MEDQNPAKKILLIRHAQSQYNLAIGKVMKSVEGKDETEARQEIATVKFGESFIDCPISEEGKKQAENGSKKLQNLPISLVLTSPLTRCLQTTQILFKDHKNRPKILVCPMIKEAMASSCDIPRDINEVKKEFPDFDFSLIDVMPVKELWHMDVLTNEDFKRIFFEDLYQMYPDKGEAIKNLQRFILSKMLKRFPEQCEPKVDLNARVTLAKKWLKEKVNEVQGEGLVAVVTHCKFLQSFISKEYGASGEFIGSRKFVNCEVFEYEF